MIYFAGLQTTVPGWPPRAQVVKKYVILVFNEICMIETRQNILFPFYSWIVIDIKGYYKMSII